MRIPYIAVFVFVTMITSFSLSQVYAENHVGGPNIPISSNWLDKSAIIYHIDDNTFVSGIQYLVQVGIIKVSD